MPRNVKLKLIAQEIKVAVATKAEVDAAEKAELRPPFLVPFEEKFNLAEIADIIGRDVEVQRVLSILSRASNANVFLLGFPGTGKTAIAQVIAKAFVEMQIDPRFISGRGDESVDVLYLDAAVLKKGKAEDKIIALEAYLKRFPNTIIFVDEAHLLGKREITDSSPIIELMKPLLNRRCSHFIMATTVEEYNEYLKPIPAIDRRATIVSVAESDRPLTKVILRQHRDTLLTKDERFRNLPYLIRIADSLVNLIVELAIRFLDPAKSGYNPSRSIGLLEQAISLLTTKNAIVDLRFGQIRTNLLKMFNEYLAAIAQEDEASVNDCRKFLLDNLRRYLKEQAEAIAAEVGTLQVEHVYEALTIMTGLTYQTFERLDRRFLDTLADELKKEVSGQDQVINEVAARIRRSKLGLGDPRRPIFGGIFAGPTGTGKTQTAKALARLLFGDENQMVVINGPEIRQEHELSKLIGAPPSYIGYGDRCKFDEVAEKNGRLVILVDEFEKMTPAAQDLFLRILDEGKAEMANGKPVDFKEAVIIFTSNLGSRELVRVAPLQTAAEDFRALIDFRKETIQAIEARAEELEGKSQAMQGESRFEDAQALIAQATAIRHFLVEETDNLQRGLFNKEKAPKGELAAFLETREAEDKLLREIFDKGGSFKFRRLLERHRQAAAAEIKRMGTELITPKLRDEFKTTYLECASPETGEYSPALLSSPGNEAVYQYALGAVERDNELRQKLEEAERMEKDRASLESENQATIEKIFAKVYKPEFLARVKAIGGIFSFNAVDRQMALAILRIHAAKFCEEQNRLYRCKVEISDDVVDFLISQVSDLSAEGGRGLEKLFGIHVRDALGEAFLKAGHRENTKVVVTLKDGGVQVNVIPLGRPDVKSLPAQEGEAGKMLDHFHQQAVDILAVYAAGYKISIEQIGALLRGEKIVSRGEQLEFPESESVNAPGIMEALADMRTSQFGQGLRLLGQHLLALSLPKELALATQASVKGLVVLAAKTFFNYILRTDFDNPRDNFDSVRPEVAAAVAASGAAKNSRLVWNVTPTEISARVSVPCKLSDREMRLFKIYAEKLATSPESAQKIFDEARKEGLVVDLSFLKSFSLLKKMTRMQAKLGFYINGSEIHYWLSLPLAASPTDIAQQLADFDLKPKKRKAAPPEAAFESRKRGDPKYLASFLKTNCPAWDEVDEAALFKRKDIGDILAALRDYLSEGVALADDEADIEFYLNDSLGLVTREEPELGKSRAFNLILDQALEAVSANSPLREQARAVVAQHAFIKTMIELGESVTPPKSDAGRAIAAAESAQLNLEGLTREDFLGILYGVQFSEQLAQNQFLLLLLNDREARITVGRDGEQLIFQVEKGRYHGTFTLSAASEASIGLVIGQMSGRIAATIAKLDRLPGSIAEPGPLVSELAELLKDIAASPYASRFIDQLLKHPAVTNSPYAFFQQGLRSRVEQKGGAARADSGKQTFLETVGAIKTYFLKLEQNEGAKIAAEQPYSEEELAADIEAMSGSGNPLLVASLKLFLGIEKGKKKPPEWSTLDQSNFYELDLGQFTSTRQVRFINDLIGQAASEALKKANSIDSAATALDNFLTFVEKQRSAQPFQETLTKAFLSLFEKGVEFVNKPEKVEPLTTVLSRFGRSWLAKAKPATFMNAARQLAAKVRGEIDEIAAEIIDFVPELAPYAIGGNQIVAYRSGGRVEGAVDTVSLLLNDRGLFGQVNNLVAREIRREGKVFEVTVQGRSFNVESLGELLANRKFFRDAGGAAIMLTIIQRGGERVLNVSVSGRTAGNAWEFETRLN